MLSPLPKGMDMELRCLHSLFCSAWTLFGFSISLVNTENGWNRLQKDKIVILRLEEYFPNCGKHTMGGTRDYFRLCRNMTANIEIVKILFLSQLSFNPSKNIWEKSLVWCLYVFKISLLLANYLLINLERALGWGLNTNKVARMAILMVIFFLWKMNLVFHVCYNAKLPLAKALQPLHRKWFYFI